MSIKQKRASKTSKVELVETHNIQSALRRLCGVPSYQEQCWRRALYHALLMEMPDKHETLANLRVALDLP